MDWRPLVEGYIANIGIYLDLFEFLRVQWFFPFFKKIVFLGILGPPYCAPTGRVTKGRVCGCGCSCNDRWLVTCDRWHVSHVMCHVSRVTCRMSCVRCNNKKNGQSGGASWSRVCYQRSLPHLVLIRKPWQVWPGKAGLSKKQVAIYRKSGQNYDTAKYVLG